MSLEVVATYENGILKPDEPLPLENNERVTVSIQTKSSGIWSHKGALRWTGDPEVLRQIAEDPVISDTEVQ